MSMILVTFTAVIILYYLEKRILNPFEVYIWWQDVNSDVMVSVFRNSNTGLIGPYIIMT